MAAQPDSERALTAEGKKRLRPVLAPGPEGGRYPRLSSSPAPIAGLWRLPSWPRRFLSTRATCCVPKPGTPSGSPAASGRRSAFTKKSRKSCLSGHEPLFSSLTAYLLASPNMQVDFKKGAIARVDLDQLRPRTPRRPQMDAAAQTRPITTVAQALKPVPQATPVNLGPYLYAAIPVTRSPITSVWI